MNPNRKQWLTFSMLLLLVLLTMGKGKIAALSPDDPPLPHVPHTITAAVASKVSYQGILEELGVPVTGVRDMEFLFHNTSGCPGPEIYAYFEAAVLVTDGVFTVAVPIPQSYINGQALWLEVIVNTTSIGCEEILPVPYALNLRAGASVTGIPATFDGWILKAETIGSFPTASTILGETATGFAVKGDSRGGAGVYGVTGNGYAVMGYDGGDEESQGYAGWFSSANGIGIKAKSNSYLHYNHGGVFEGYYGYGLYANSTYNSAIRGIGGDPTDMMSVTLPVGTEGVVGISGEETGVYGTSREDYGVIGKSVNSDGVNGQSTFGTGVYGSSSNATGVYGYSSSTNTGNGFAGYFYSEHQIGLFARGGALWWGAEIDNALGAAGPGLFVDGALVATASKVGYVADVVKNAGPEPLETGDVVVIVGMDEPILGEIPVILVRKSVMTATTAVAGVVDQPWSAGSGISPTLQVKDETPLPHPTAAEANISTQTEVKTGEYLTMVTLGAYKAIKVDATYGAIQPGDLLVSSPTPGHAMRSENPKPGTIIGKAVGSLTEGQGVIPVLVTLD